MDEDVVCPRGGVRGSVHCEDIGDAQEGDDDEQRLGRLPVLVVVRLGGAARRPEFRHHDLEEIRVF